MSAADDTYAFYEIAARIPSLRELLAINAPPVPDWFQPALPVGRDPVEYEAWRMAQWPWAYADMVLAARERRKAVA